MFKRIRIAFLLLVLFFVSVDTWLTAARNTDWNDSLYVTVYPINADGSDTAAKYVSKLEPRIFAGIEEFAAREVGRYGHTMDQPVRIKLGQPITEQPPSLGDSPSRLSVMWWSMKMRWWASSIADDQNEPFDPDVRIFVRYHAPQEEFVLENSVGLQKGMVGVVNAFAGHSHAGANNVVIAHEFLHTLGATDKYDPANGFPDYPLGVAEPDRSPVYPQRYAEIMGGRIPLSSVDAIIPKSLKHVVIGDTTAEEINLR